MADTQPVPMIPVHVEPQRLTRAEGHRFDRLLLGPAHERRGGWLARRPEFRTRLRILALDRAPRTEFGAAAIVGGPL